MKIIFSRKGFDSKAGRVPSALVYGRPVSFPIPAPDLDHTTYDDMGEELVALMRDLVPSKDTRFHLDPDIHEGARNKPRPNGWRGAFGQIGPAQTHLANNGVGRGDLFIFWGLFQDVERIGGRWRYRGQPRHMIFGWLQVARVIPVGHQGWKLIDEFPWLADHSHAKRGWEVFGPKTNNTIYIAEETLSLWRGATPGFGVLGQAYQLTDPSSRLKSHWKLPDFLNPHKGGSGLSYNPLPRWSEDGTLITPGRGQEFVADVGQSAAATHWLRSIGIC